MLSSFSFHADFGAGEVELFPTNDDLIFSEEKDEDFGFYRRELQTTLIFKGDDFETLYALEQTGNCQQYDIDIRYKGAPYYTGIAKFSTSAFKWYVDLCKVEVKLEPQDAYTCLIESWEEEIDILSPDIKKEKVRILSGEIENNFCQHNTAVDGPYLEYQDYVDCLPSGEGWTVIDHYAQNNSDPANYTVTTSYQREAITIPCVGGVPAPPPGDGWILVTDNCPTNSTYARTLVVEQNIPENINMGGPTANPDEIFYRDTFKVSGRAFLGETLQADNAVLLENLLNFYPPCPGLTIVSNLFDINPSGDNPSGGPYDDPRTHDLIVWQKSDIINADAYTNATTGSGIWTWLEMLRTFNVLYDAEPRIIGNTLRIEHSTYWEKDEGLDLTQSPYAPYIAGRYEYEYDSAAIPRREAWAFPEPVSMDFLGGPITYGCYATADLQDQVYQIERVNTDIGYITLNPDKINIDGFVIGEGYFDGSAYSIVSRYVYPGTDLQVNGSHAIPSLIDFFHRWNRPAIEGTLLRNAEIFNSAVRRKKQVRLQFKLSAEEYLTFNPDNLMRSQMGWGQVQSLTWSAKTCTVTVELMHE